MNNIIRSVLTALFFAGAVGAQAQTTTDHQHTRPPYTGPQKNQTDKSIPAKHKGHYKPRKAKPASSHVEVR